MASIRELQNEHLEVVQRIHALEQEIGTLVVSQVLEGTEAVMRFPSFIDKAILPHFSIEERAVFPLLEKGSAQGTSLRDELLADHLSLKESFFHYLMEVQQGKGYPRAPDHGPRYLQSSARACPERGCLLNPFAPQMVRHRERAATTTTRSTHCFLRPRNTRVTVCYNPSLVKQTKVH